MWGRGGIDVGVPTKLIFLMLKLYVTKKYVLLTWMEVRSDSHSSQYIHVEITPGTHWRNGWVDIRTSLDDVKKRMILIQKHKIGKET
jgi:hypothetical protein